MRSYFTHVAALPAILELLLNFSEKAISGFEPTHSVQNALRPKKSPVIGTNLQFLIYKMSISLYLVKKSISEKEKRRKSCRKEEMVTCVLYVLWQLASTFSVFTVQNLTLRIILLYNIFQV